MATCKLKNFQITNALNTINEIDDRGFSTKVAFRLASWATSLSSALEAFEEQREKLVKRHAKKDEDGEFIAPKDEEGNILEGQVNIENPKEFNKEITELANEQVTVSLKVSLSFEDFDDEDVEVKPSEITPLLPLIEASSE